MVTAYKILTGELDGEKYDIERMVNKAIQEGWIPLGGVCETVSVSYKRSFAQAMIKEGEKVK